MALELHLLLPVCIVIFGGGVVQGSAGFGYALFSVPFLLWIGLPLHQTIVIVSICSFVQATTGTWHLRRQVPWRVTAWACGLRAVAVVPGVLLLKELVGMRLADVRFIVGCILCAAVVLLAVLRPKPVKRLHPVWGVLAFPASGLLAGATGMGGPPMALWAVAHDWPSGRVRGFLFSIFSISLPVQLVLLGIVFGEVVWRSCLVGLMVSPSAVLGSIVGLRIGHQLSRRVLRAVVFTMLLIIAVNAMLPRLLEGSM